MNNLRCFFLTFYLIVGLLCCASPVLAQSGFSVVDLSSGITFTTIDVPGAVFTGIAGVNTSGQLVGDYGQNLSGDVHVKLPLL